MSKNKKGDKSIFHIVASGKKATLYLYGDISEWAEEASPIKIVKALKAAEAAYESIELRINSLGGDVYAGMAIFNALSASKADITIYIDGIAASMASVVALCGKPVYMSKYARLMIHSVRGGTHGTKEELGALIKEIEALEDMLASIYAKKMGLNVEEIHQSYFDGKDHWVTADEALQLGLIDGIYDTEALQETPLSTEIIYNTFNNRLKSQQTVYKMNIENFKKRAAFTAVSSEEDVLKVVDRLEVEAAQAAEKEQELVSLRASLKKHEEAAEATRVAEITALLDAAETDGRINAQTRPAFKALLDADRKNGEAALGALQARKKAIDEINVHVGGDDSPWNKRMETIKNKLEK